MATTFPAHEKLKDWKAGTDPIQFVHDFLEWLSDKHQVELGQWHGNGFDPSGRFDKFMWEYIGVDPDDLESEKRDMLNMQRGLNQS